MIFSPVLRHQSGVGGRERANKIVGMCSKPVVEVGRRAVRNRSAITPSLRLSFMDARCGFGPAPQRFVPPRPGNFPSHENSGRQGMEKVVCLMDEGACTRRRWSLGDAVREGQ